MDDIPVALDECHPAMIGVLGGFTQESFGITACHRGSFLITIVFTWSSLSISAAIRNASVLVGSVPVIVGTLVVIVYVNCDLFIVDLFPQMYGYRYQTTKSFFNYFSLSFSKCCKTMCYNQK